MTVIASLAAKDPSVLTTAQQVFSNTYMLAPAYNPAPGLDKVDNDGEPSTRYRPMWPDPSTLFHAESDDNVSATAWLNGAYDDDAWWALA